jgi:hypothetical protein
MLNMTKREIFLTGIYITGMSLAFIALLPLISFGSEYIIVGSDSNGNYYYGEVKVERGKGTGHIKSEEGESKKIDLERTEKVIFTGYDEDGNYYELEKE